MTTKIDVCNGCFRVWKNNRLHCTYYQNEDTTWTIDFGDKTLLYALTEEEASIEATKKKPKTGYAAITNFV